MVKKPAAVVKKQHKPEGLGPITKFFDPRPPCRESSPPVPADGIQVEVPRGAALTPTTQADDRQPPPQAAALTWRPKHLMETADPCMMSQDTDALCVVWHDSPGTAGQAMFPAAAGAAGAAAPGHAAPGPHRQNFDAIKQRLISVAQRPRGQQPARARGQPLLAGHVQPAVGIQADALLERLFSHEQIRPAGEAGAASGSGPEGSVFSAGFSDGTGAVHVCHKTPATHLKGILKKPQSAGKGQRATPGSCVKFNLGGGSAVKLAVGRSAKQATTTNKKRQSGQKRKALLELLEQVESLVQSGGGSSQEEGEEEEEPGSQDKENSQQVNSQGCEPPLVLAKTSQQPADDHQQQQQQQQKQQGQSHAGRTGLSGQGAPQQHGTNGPRQQQQPAQQQQLHQPVEAVVDSNRSIPPLQPEGQGAWAGCGPVVHQASQRLQQGLVRSTHQAPPQPTAQRGTLPFPSITTGAVPPPRQAGPAAHRSMQAQEAGAAHSRAAAGVRGKAQPMEQRREGAPSSSGFGCDSMDEDDLLAELELQLVTQVEQQHAATRQALSQRRGGDPSHRPVSPGASWPVQPAAGAPGAAAGHGVQTEARPAAACDPAGHDAPAAAPLQAVVAPADQGGPTPAAEPAAAPAGHEGAAEAPENPPQPAAATACAAAGSGGDVAVDILDSWGDDDDFLDTEVLGHAEAAALADQAKRWSSEETTGASGQQPGAAGVPPPKFPGDRVNVNYSITEVINNEHDQILRLYNKHKGQEVFAHLRAPWTDLPYRVGDVVSLVARLDEYNGQYHCLLDMENGLLVLHPDMLLSGTRITGSNNCPRQSILDEKIAGDGSSAVAVKGTLQHSLIQAALAENLRTARELHRKAEEIVAASAEALLEVDMDEAGAMAYLLEATPGILRWMSRFLKEVPGQDSIVSGGFDPLTNREIVRSVAVQEVVDIEESVWATKFGIKGMIDVSVKMAMQDSAAARQRQPQQPQGWMQSGAVQRQPQPTAGTVGLESVIAPIEIKTGKPHDSHRAQVLLYLLLMEERYGKALDWGLLWYTTQPNPQLVRRKPHELSSLMAVRNRLAAYITHGEMAPLADFKKQCHWCFQKHHCALYHKAIEGGTVDTFKRVSTDRTGGDPHNVASIFDKQAGHLSPADCEFLKKWANLIDLEEGGTLTRRAEIWSVPAEERERQSGRCLAGLVLQHVDEGQGLYTFRRSDGSGFPEGGSLAEGEMVVLSMEGQHVTVARAVIYALTPSAVTVSLRKPLRRGLLLPAEIASGISTTQPTQAQQQAQHQQQGAGPAPMAVDDPVSAPAGPTAAGAAGTAGQAPIAAVVSAEFDPSTRWRLDKDDVSSTFVKLRRALFSLFRPDDERAARLRRLLVELAPPEAAPLQGVDPKPAGMNNEQHEAVRRVLAAKDYTLVLGMPGAGKTTTIVSIVQALVSLGKSVLVTSYTNSAVDTILMKLAGEGVPFVRLGQEKSVHPGVLPYVPGGEQHPHTTVAALKQLGESIPVVGATCFGVSHAMLKNKVFDVCILDEAGQVTLPASLGPLLKSRAFVLVGDHNQLPPLVANRQAEEGGMGVSLFKMLSDAHPQAVVSLPVQYRMAADIQELANQLFYDNRLRCGTPAVATGVLALPPQGMAVLPTLPCWLQQVLAPERRVLFLDTADVTGATESLAGETLSNPAEAGLVLQLLRGLADAGVAQERMGVISPYRAQVSLLERLTKAGRLSGVECLTVDKCQGRDKDCIVVSFVRSNQQREAGKLLQDWRRINVAVTRAKGKLVLVGNSVTLGTLPLFERLVGLVQGRGWYLRLPAGVCSSCGGSG